MYSSSSQKKHWTFENEEELNKYRFNANKKYLSSIKESNEKEDDVYYLKPEEELVTVKHYEYFLKDFLHSFTPKNEPLPKDVKGTAFHYYKRFFLVSSVMDYHPKEVMITCVFLACKTCEYHVPINLFVKNIEGNPVLLKNIILDQEMELLYRLNFKINIHLPGRAVEGFMIDLKTRSKLHQPERLYEHIGRFLASMWFTDVCLLYPPSVIALAAVLHATSRCKENIDKFVLNSILGCPSEKMLCAVINKVRKVRATVMNAKPAPTAEAVIRLESLLATCRNPRNNPNTEEFKRRMLEISLETYLQAEGSKVTQ